VATVLALDAGKTIVENAAIKIAVDHVFHISTEEAILGGETVVIDLLKRLKMIFNATVILGFMWLARAVYGRILRHDPKAFWIAAGVDFLDCACPESRSTPRRG